MQRTYGSHEQLLASQEGRCSVRLIRRAQVLQFSFCEEPQRIPLLFTFFYICGFQIAIQLDFLFFPFSCSFGDSCI